MLLGYPTRNYRIANRQSGHRRTTSRAQVRVKQQRQTVMLQQIVIVIAIVQQIVRLIVIAIRIVFVVIVIVLLVSQKLYVAVLFVTVGIVG